MTTAIKNYAVVLHSLDVERSSVDEAKKICEQNKELISALCDPRVSFSQKEKVIDRIFDGQMASFLKVVCKNNKAQELTNIFEAYSNICETADGTLLASVICTVPPTKEQQEKIKKFLCKRYSAKNVKLDVIHDESIIGGFILKCGDMEFDRSLKGKLNKLQQKLIGDMK